MRALILATASVAAASAFVVPAHAASAASWPEVVVTARGAPARARDRDEQDADARREGTQARPRLSHEPGVPGRARQPAEPRRSKASLPSRRRPQVVRRFRIVVDGLEVVAPAADLAGLSRIPGVAAVERSGAYGPTLEASPQVIGAPDLWGLPSLSSAGSGLKIGIIDMGIDPKLPVLRSRRLRIPAGLPEGRSLVDVAEGDRRPRLLSSRRDVEVRARALRPRELGSRRPRGRDRRRQLRHTGDRRTRRCRASRRRRTSGTTRSLPPTRPSSASSRTRARSSRPSRPPCGTGWT